MHFTNQLYVWIHKLDCLMVNIHTIGCDCEEYYIQCNEGSPSEFYTEVVNTGWL